MGGCLDGFVGAGGIVLGDINGCHPPKFGRVGTVLAAYWRDVRINCTFEHHSILVALSWQQRIVPSDC